MHAAVAAADPRALAAVPAFKSCPAHRERYERRRSPCRRRWTDCADCKGLGVNHRRPSRLPGPPRLRRRTEPTSLSRS